MTPDRTECLTILVADDFADARFVFKRWLEVKDYRVLEAGSGVEAVEMARRDCPDLILMDLNMPEMDGLEASRRIRELRGAHERVPIIAITAYHTYGIEEAAREAGCNGYLAKPVDLDDLDKILRRFLP